MLWVSWETRCDISLAFYSFPLLFLSSFPLLFPLHHQYVRKLRFGKSCICYGYHVISPSRLPLSISSFLLFSFPSLFCFLCLLSSIIPHARKLYMLWVSWGTRCDVYPLFPSFLFSSPSSPLSPFCSLLPLVPLSPHFTLSFSITFSLIYFFNRKYQILL